MTMRSAQRWILWVFATAGSVVVSYVVWWLWGMAFCGEEVYDTPPGSTGDALCGALVDPVWPWALVAAVPALLTLLGGFLGLVLRRPRLYSLSLVAPAAIGVLTLFLAPALF